MKEYKVAYTYIGKGIFTIKAKTLADAKEMFLTGEVDDFVEEREIEFVDEKDYYDEQ